MTKKRPVTITMRQNKDGTITMKSTGGFDLRKIVPQLADVNPTPKKDK